MRGPPRLRIEPWTASRARPPGSCDPAPSCRATGPAGRHCRRRRRRHPSRAAAGRDMSLRRRQIRSLLPGVHGHHQMARKAFHQPAGADVVEALLLQRGRQRTQPGSSRPSTRCGCGAEHQPIRRLVFARAVRPGQPAAADQAAIDADRVGPAERDRPLRRGVRQQRIGQRHHAGVERRRALRSGSSGSSTTANSARSKRPTCTSVPAPASAAIACACAKASPTSRSVTRRKGGGRSSAGAAVVRLRLCISRSAFPRAWRFVFRTIII